MHSFAHTPSLGAEITRLFNCSRDVRAVLKPRCLLLNLWFFPLFWEPKSPVWNPLWNAVQDSRRFEGIDADFKELANTVHQTPNVVEATNEPGLFGKLEDIQSRWEFCLFLLLMSVIRGGLVQGLYILHRDAHTHWLCVSLYRLSLCEKALAEYLDTKRLAFPRFYFISSADLLDILSNGTNPHQVAPLIFAWGVAVNFMLQSVQKKNFLHHAQHFLQAYF